MFTFDPSLLSSVVVVVIVVVVIVVIVIVVVIVVIDIDHVDAYSCSNTGSFYHDVNHQPDKRKTLTMMMKTLMMLTMKLTTMMTMN